MKPLHITPCALRFAPCSLLFALSSMLLALRSQPYALFILFSVLILLPAYEQNPHNGTVLTVMTYNMGDDELPAPTTEQLVQIIRKNGVPDILLVQEVPWKTTIKDLAEALGYPYFVSGRTESSLHHMGILSNLPLLNKDRIHF